MAKSKFKTAMPREIGTIQVQCFAKPVLFGKWDEMPQAARDEFANNGPIPCEGGGKLGTWCDGCRFGSVSQAD